MGWPPVTRTRLHDFVHDSVSVRKRGEMAEVWRRLALSKRPPISFTVLFDVVSANGAGENRPDRVKACCLPVAEPPVCKTLAVNSGLGY